MDEKIRHHQRGFKMTRKLNIKKDRKEIARIIKINLPLLNKNPKIMCQEIADCILAYLIGALEEK